MTQEELFLLTPKQIDQDLYFAAKQRWDEKQKPLDGLGDFEKVTSQIMAINKTLQIQVPKKVLVILCADHGIVEEGVSQCGQEVTLSVAKALGENCSSASRMAAYAGCDYIAVDVGINSTCEIQGVRNCKVSSGTANFLKQEAMNEEALVSAIAVGITLAQECKAKGYQLLATGEMGIGNTTSGTAVLCGLTGIAIDQVLGRGAGLSDEGLMCKGNVIRKALALYGYGNGVDTKEEALQVMQRLGGLELAAMTGLFIGGASVGLPVMIDGVLSAVSALLAELVMPGAKNYMIASHAGREKGTGIVLEKLGLKPLLNGDMALGEGTGALMAMPLIDMAFDFYNHALTFQQGGVKPYERMDSVKA